MTSDFKKHQQTCVSPTAAHPHPRPGPRRPGPRQAGRGPVVRDALPHAGGSRRPVSRAAAARSGASAASRADSTQRLLAVAPGLSPERTSASACAGPRFQGRGCLPARGPRRRAAGRRRVPELPSALPGPRPGSPTAATPGQPRALATTSAHGAAELPPRSPVAEAPGPAASPTAGSETAGRLDIRPGRRT